MTRHLKQPSFRIALGIATAVVISFAAIAQNAAPQSTSASTPTAATKAKPTVKSLDASGKAGAVSNQHETVEYKDPEDMTTRYRPGNNKTSAVPTDASGSTDAKKHLANVKYADRQATVPALDAASKDAAKSQAAPPATPGMSKQGTSTTQDSKRANKVDSFTVKQ